MIYYSQSTGKWTDETGAVLLEGCYAGAGEGKNNPAMEGVYDVGPVPSGVYTISPVHTIQHKGLAMCLTPDPATQKKLIQLGRGGFLIHLDNPAHPGESSEGCIVAPSLGGLMTIQQARESGETQVTVTA